MQRFSCIKNLKASLMISVLVFGQAFSAQDKNSYLEVFKNKSKSFAAMQAGALYGAGRGVQGAGNETLEQIPGYVIDGVNYGINIGVILGMYAAVIPLGGPGAMLGLLYGFMSSNPTFSNQQRYKHYDRCMELGSCYGLMLGASVVTLPCVTLGAVTGVCAGTLHGVTVGGVNGLQQGAQEGYDAVQNIEKLTSGNEVVETAAWVGAASAVPVTALAGAIYIYREPIKEIIQGLLRKS